MAPAPDDSLGTTARVLRLLGLLQSRALWTSDELAERLGVTTRSVRRDVKRLRALGYPVKASRGSGGGYQLGRGKALPPLLLDPQEAVAVAVSLSLAAGGSVTGVDEAALRALAKLDQVLPASLREQVTAVQESTVAVSRNIPLVDPEILTTLARACRDRVRARFDYAPRDRETAERSVEPYRLVSLGNRWYLLAFDLDRGDWRSFRLDRISRGTVHPTTFTFPRREAPDAAAFVQRGVTHAAYRYVARLAVGAPAHLVQERVPPAAGTVTPTGDDTCELVTGADTLHYLVGRLILMDLPFTVLEPADLADELRRTAQALERAASSVSANASTT